jgi:uncharacterized Zn finger protein
VCADIARFFERVGAGRPCESCGVTDWVIIEERGKTAGLPTYSEPEAAAPLDKYFPIVLVGCKNCGLIRAHLRVLIDEKNAEVKNGG